MLEQEAGRRWGNAVASGAGRLYAPPQGDRSSSRASPGTRSSASASISAATAPGGRVPATNSERLCSRTGASSPPRPERNRLASRYEPWLSVASSGSAPWSPASAAAVSSSEAVIAPMIWISSGAPGSAGAAASRLAAICGGASGAHSCQAVSRAVASWAGKRSRNAVVGGAGSVRNRSAVTIPKALCPAPLSAHSRSA